MPPSGTSFLISDVDFFDGLEWIRIQTDHHHFEPHTHGHFVVGMVETGTERFMHRGSHLLASPGDLSLVNPDVVHTGEPASSEGYVYRAFYPQASFLQNIAPQNALPYFRPPVVHDPALMQRFLHIHQELNRRFLQSGPGMDLGLDTALLDAFLLLLQKHAERKAHHVIRGSWIIGTKNIGLIKKIPSQSTFF